MTTYYWLHKRLRNMFCPCDKVYNYGYVSRPTYYSGVGVRDKVLNSMHSFVYKLWDTTVFEAECQKKRKNSYIFYPCYSSAVTRDRLNMIAEILDVPVRFTLKDDCLYADEMMCDFVKVYPEIGKIVYDVHGEKNNYQVIKIYDKKGVRWV